MRFNVEGWLCEKCFLTGDKALLSFELFFGEFTLGYSGHLSFTRIVSMRTRAAVDKAYAILQWDPCLLLIFL